MIRVYGWKPDRPDFRDQEFDQIVSQAVLPSSYNLRDKFPKPYDQGELGSCTANALGAMVAYTLLKENKLSMPVANTANGTPSRLFIYYNERAIEGTVNQDSGAMIRDGIKTLVTQGTCFENLWPYTISQFTRRPSVMAYKAALADTVKAYQRVDVSSLTAKKSAIFSGKPIAIGFSVYESFESEAVAKTGLVPMPSKKETQLGGHAVVIVGYDDNKLIGKSKGAFIVRNSWGLNWGDQGYCYMPYEYLNNPNLCDDNWIISVV